MAWARFISSLSLHDANGSAMTAVCDVASISVASAEMYLFSCWFGVVDAVVEHAVSMPPVNSIAIPSTDNCSCDDDPSEDLRTTYKPKPAKYIYGANVFSSLQ